jgi:ABC-type dipeptide/oligopeptide/nickel transport system ATPase subunit
MHALSKTRGTATFEQLQKELRIEKETLESWIASAASKYLVVQKNNEIQLHFQDPKITVVPETKMTDWLVKKPYNHAQRVSSRYTISQIQKVAKAAYGEDFSVRSSTEVFLPVYNIEVLNPDGSTFTSFWNAITGQQMNPRYNFKG